MSVEGVGKSEKRWKVWGSVGVVRRGGGDCVRKDKGKCGEDVRKCLGVSGKMWGVW